MAIRKMRRLNVRSELLEEGDILIDVIVLYSVLIYNCVIILPAASSMAYVPESQI